MAPFLPGGCFHSQMGSSSRRIYDPIWPAFLGGHSYFYSYFCPNTVHKISTNADSWGFLKVVAGDGIEPPTQGFSVLCSTD
jgi:hypothetical protein